MKGGTTIKDSPQGGLSRFHRGAILLAGLVISQAILFGPAMVGSKILLPVDILGLPSVYLPQDSGPPQNAAQLDLVFVVEPARRFAAEEFRAGRLPLWTPYGYCGAPFATFAKYSPFNVIYYLVPSPYTLVWIQIIKSIVAGMGVYFFFRRTLHVSFWPAAVGAWCFPLIGYFMLWQGYPATLVTTWTGWILLAVDRAVRRPGARTGIYLALFTALVLLSGKLDVAAQVLLISGLYAVWCLLDQYVLASRPPLLRKLGLSTGHVALGWALGFLLAAPYLLPLLEYAQSGARVTDRVAGEEERPPVGLQALPLVVLPLSDGSIRKGHAYIGNAGTHLESASATYVGLVAALFVAPLAFFSRRHLSINVFWLILGLIGLAWSLNVPILVSILRLPVMNAMSHNRLVFATSFAILSLAVVGLHLLWRGEVVSGKAARRRLYVLAAVALALLMGWCLYRSVSLPEPLASRMGQAIADGRTAQGISELQPLETAKRNFRLGSGFSAALCLIALCAWVSLLRSKQPIRWMPWVISSVMVIDLMWFAYGENPQCEPALYYPKVPALEDVAHAEPGRILAIHSLPPSLSQSHRLRDIRGYDGVDSTRYLQLLTALENKKWSVSTPHAKTAGYVPNLRLRQDGEVRFPPALDMLNLRYVIFRQEQAGPTPWVQRDNYYVFRNSVALPRVYVPKNVQTETRDEAILQRVASLQFDPQQIAYVEEATPLPSNIQGAAQLVSEVPTHLSLRADMKTPGLVVLAERWDPGWRAYVDGGSVPVLRTNYVLCGVVLPEGESIVDFRYQPTSLRQGLQLMLVGLLGLAAWGGLHLWRRRSQRSC